MIVDSNKTLGMASPLYDTAKNSEAKFKATFNQVAVGMAHVSLDGTFLILNQKFCDITGYSSEELMKLKFQNITHPEDLDRDLGYAHQLLSGEIQTYSLEKRYVTKQGKIVWINLTGSLVRSAEQKPLFFIAVIEDIGLRKQAESELSLLQLELEEKVRARTAELENASRQLLFEMKVRLDAENERNRFFTISSDAMIVFEQSGKIRKFNSAFAEILGYSTTEIATIDILKLVHPEDLAQLPIANEQLQKTHHLKNFENRYIRKDGQIIYLSWTASLYSEESLIYAIARDITEHKKNERIRNEERLKASAASKIHALGRMAAGVAHEINNPLTIVYGQAYLLRNFANKGNIKAEDINTIAGKIEKMSARIVEIVSGLRTFAREDAADAFSLVKLKSILKDTLSFCQHKLEIEGIQLSLPQIPDDVEVSCRSVQISQVLLNLLNNSRDAVELKEIKKIDVLFIETPDHVGLAIEDNGTGLSEETKNHLFEPFFSTKEVGKGTGLGLSVSKGIIDSHRGHLYAEDVKPEGVRFVFLLPRAESRKQSN